MCGSGAVVMDQHDSELNAIQAMGANALSDLRSTITIYAPQEVERVNRKS